MTKPRFANNWLRPPSVEELRREIQNIYDILSDQEQEYGSNDNGEYLRLPDGIQICWRTFTISATGTTWTFPIEFNEVPVISGVAHHNSVEGRVVVSYTPTTTSVEVIRYDTDLGAGETGSGSLIAIGGWS